MDTKPKPQPKPQPTVPCWTERYNCHALVLGKGTIRIGVSWSIIRERNGYDVSVNDLHLRNPIASLDDAKQVGIDLARRLMQHATHELDLLRMQTPVKADVPAASLKVTK